MREETKDAIVTWLMGLAPFWYFGLVVAVVWLVEVLRRH
jgi:hypothetical protein